MTDFFQVLLIQTKIYNTFYKSFDTLIRCVLKLDFAGDPCKETSLLMWER